MEAYRELMLANGDGDKPIWLTQFGWAVSDRTQAGFEYARDNTVEEQAQWTIDAYRWGLQQDWVGPMFLFNLDYGLTQPDEYMAGFGLIDQPVYEALTELTRATN